MDTPRELIGVATALLVAAAFAALWGCGPMMSAPTGAYSEESGLISSDEARRLIDEEDAQLVDVRSGTEYGMGHLPDATHIPVSQIADRARDELDSERPVIVYCLSGHRSARATEALELLGFEVYDLGSLHFW